MVNAVRIHPSDNVATVTAPLKRGDCAVYLDPAGIEISTVLENDIPVYHKYALRPISQGEAIVKYGEHIGAASQDISAGQHVHTHNVCGKRENLRDRG